MKIVYSYWNYEKNKKHNYIDSNIIFISLKSVKKLGYKTLLYCDENNYDNLKDFEFDEIKVFNQKELDLLPYNVWCLGKILAFSKMDEHFCHIDFDVILLKDVISQLKNEKLFCLHREPWRKIYDYRFRNEILNRFPEFKEIYNKDLKTYNCAIIGGTNFNEINYNANLLLNFSKQNKDFLEQKHQELLNFGNHWNMPVFLEQVIFMNLCKKMIGIEDIGHIYNLDSLNLDATQEDGWANVYEQMVDKGLIHLWGYKKYFSKKLIDIILKK